ncbi:non-ribosomal peptide synthetase/type I polyketide synthase [uncultured Tateyamaria sp.]|uniref:non-ribosomal peptide synthetase/type I polyketide synthase n=1 Tax=uncultured Tateyamaria sp. TaxID=455651 RepID=UPI00261B5786|nr:non-ribosomal peptide synthetase/type I polyketide synthase [uncultured Tateyamaria sp.]
MRPLSDMLHELAGLGIELEANADKLRIRGPASALGPALREELKARKAELLAHLTAPASPVSVPLLPNQRRLWFIDKLTDAATGFALQAAFVLPRQYTVAEWQDALDQLCAHHPVLDTQLIEEGDAPFLQVRPQGPRAEVHVDRLPDDAPDFDALRPTNAGLFRCAVWPRETGQSLVVLSLHHMISDRQSMSTVMQDLLHLLDGQPLTKAGRDFLDIMAQDGSAARPHAAEGLAYWTQTLSDAPADLTLPYDHARPDRRGVQGAVHRFVLSDAANLGPLAQRNNATAFATYLAVYAQLLSQWSGQTDLVIGCPVSGRYMPGTETSVGYFVNTVALRLNLDATDIASVIERARTVVMGAMEHQDVPFDHVVSALSPDRHLNRNPLFQAMFVLQPPSGNAPVFAGEPVDILPAPPLAPDVDISLMLEETAQGYAGYLEYDPDLFDPETIALFAQQFEALCQTYAGNSQTAEQRLAHWQGPDAPRPRGDMWSVLGSALKELPADHLVLEDPDGAVTKSEVLAQANAVAAGLMAQGVGSAAPVGISLARTRDRAAAMLGVWKAGATVVFLPVIGQDKSAQQVFADRVSKGAIGHVICDTASSDDAGTTATLLPFSSFSSVEEISREGLADGPAYLCFTSGTTGTAKAVAVGHDSLINHMMGIAEQFALTPADRVLQFAPTSFDMVFEDMLPALMLGASLIVPEADALADMDRFQAMISDAGITVANLPAPFWHAWVHELDATQTTAPAALRLVITGSDVVHGEAAWVWRSRCPETSLMSGYGLTESTITAMLHTPAADPSDIGLGALPLGVPLPNVAVSVVGPDGEPVPTMVVGEIAISGAAVAMGYVGAQSDHRFRQVGDEPQFMTGDLGRMRRDGHLEFLGRRDQQIKIRGVRVEPSAVEAVVMRLATVSEAAVVPRPSPTGQWGLAAYIVGDQTADHYTEELRHALPGAMVPQTVVTVPALPRTDAGKIDRRALARAPIEITATPTRAPTAQEARLAAIFADVLGQKRVGPDDNFFALGGDSITSLQIVARARRAGFALTAAQVFEHQTVAALAAHVNDLPTQDVGETSGPIPATPIMAWFATQFDQPWKHFNQSVMLAMPADLNTDALRAALQSVADAHPIFALRVDPDAAQPFSISETAEAPAFFTHTTEDGQADALDRVQASLDPTEGRNIAALWLPHQNRLMVTIHHLCIDVLSWDVLLRDLETAYDAACAETHTQITPAGASFRTWAERLNTFAKDSGVSGTVAHFMQSLGGATDPILGAPVAAGQDRDITSFRLTLPAGVTSDILRHAAVAYETRADEALLVALLMALDKRGSSGVRVDLERNGRTSPFADLDLADTIGWFTSVMPLRLMPGDDVAALAQQVRRATQDSPHDGLGFGLARYCGTSATRTALASLPEADVLLNYVGVLTGWEDAPFRPVDAPCGTTIALDTERSHVVEINAGVVAGQMRIEMIAPSSAGAEAEGLAQALETAISDLASQARQARFGADMGDNVEDVAPATPLQHRILLHSMRRPDTYFDQLRFTLDGPLDVDAMQRSWDMLVHRHKSLRTNFGFAGDDSPLQIVRQSLDMQWHHLDWRDVAPGTIARLLTDVMQVDRAVGFDIENGPLMRMHLIRRSDTQYDWIWSAHHLVLDGWSVSVVIEEWQSIYAALVRGDTPQLAPAADPSDYAAWLGQTDSGAARAFWAEHLAGAEATLIAKEQDRATAAATQAPGTDRIDLSPEVEQQLGALARDLGTTVGVIAQAAWALVLRRYGHSGAVLFGLTVSNRPPDIAGADRMVGMMINTLPVRVDLSGADTPRGVMARMSAQARARAPWSALSLDNILSAGGFGDTLPFDTMMLVQNYPQPETLSAGDVTVGLSEVAERTDLPLTLVVQSGDDPCLMAVWDRDRLGDAQVQSMLGHWHRVMTAFLADADQTLDGISIYSDAELAARVELAQGSSGDAETPRAVEAVAHWARILPDQTALVADDGVLSYRALDAAVAALAARLTAQEGLQPGASVAVLLPRSTRAIVALLAVMRAGGVAVPVDAAYPADRIAYILADCGAELVVTQTGMAQPLDSVTVVLCDTLEVAETPTGTGELPAPDSPAYMIYTSGSTGQPKGTLTHHGGVDNMIAAQALAFDLGPADRVLQFASLSFDASVWEMFMALAAGAALYVPTREQALGGRELAEYMADHRITAATLPPTVIGGVLPEQVPDLSLLVAAGEVCPRHLGQTWAKDRRFYNAYGPSEASVCATLHQVETAEHTVPIGTAIAGAVAYAVDQDGHLVPMGGTGELVIGGAGVGLGYHGRPELTARAFVPDKWRQDARARAYRTGDRVEVGANGALVFRGRLDRQIKLRGFRVEPGEVENALMQDPAVHRALVGVRSSDGMSRLLAWVVPVAGAAVSPDGLREMLAQQLPGHMVPASVVVVDDVPLTPNGKVDWAALPDASDDAPAEPAPEVETKVAVAPPAATLTTEERMILKLTEIWSELLDGRSVAPDQNFFDAGGHSLLLVRMQPMLKEAFGVQVRTRTLFDNLTISALATVLCDAGAQVPDDVAVAEPVPAADEAVKAPAIGTARTAEPIAVIGMACRFPGAPDLAAYWDMLRRGDEGLCDLTHADLIAAGVNATDAENPAYVARRGIIDHADSFDAGAFGIGPSEAELMDPQQRLFLECAWHALEDAGQRPRSGQNTGVFAGAGYNTWMNEVLRPAGHSMEGSAGYHAVTANEKDFLATQTAFRLDLRGPAVSVQTACSTSLVAVVQAVQALRSGQCETAVAGGVSVAFPTHRGYMYEPDMILSPDGHCRPFGAEAAGTVPSSGVGAVILKPLDEAQQDGDRVYGVIRGTGLGNDGARKMSFAAPGVDGQADAMRAALDDAGLLPSDVDAIEAHGTGTALGDPVEMTAIARVYADRSTPLSIGSVKGNIGHADAAAGIAGFIKSVLGLWHGEMPASLHADTVNPRLDLADGALRISSDRLTLGPRARAGVSSFGIGGTNAHVVLERAETQQNNAVCGPEEWQVLPLSGHSNDAVVDGANALSEHLRTSTTPLAQVAATLQSGRAALRYRTAVLAQDTHRADAARALGDVAPGKASQVDAAFLFAGQGSQHLAMGRVLYERYQAYRDAMDDIDGRITPLLGQSLHGLIMSGDASAEQTLRDTRYAQPAVFAVSLATARLWQAVGLQPRAVLGHSVGEFAAAHIAGVMDLNEALRLIVARSALVAEQPVGGMLATTMTAEAAQTYVGDGIEIAAYNGPQQVVFAGPSDPLDTLRATLDAQGTPCHPLATSHAFHSAMLAPARDAFRSCIDTSKLSPPTVPFASTVTGGWVEAQDLLSRDYWADHICKPVRCAQAMSALADNAAMVGLDMGPGTTMTSLAAANGIECLPSHDVPGGPTDDAQQPPAVLSTLATLWRRGVDVNWDAMRKGQPRKTSLPLTPFARTRYTPTAAPTSDWPAKRADMGTWFYRPALSAVAKPTGVDWGGKVLVVTDVPDGAAETRQSILPPGTDTQVVDIALTAPDQVLSGQIAGCSHLVFVLTADYGSDWTVLQSVLAWVRRFVGEQGTLARGLHLVTHGGAPVGDIGPVIPMQSAIRSAFEVLAVEHPELEVSGVDIGGAVPASLVVPAAGFLVWHDGAYHDIQPTAAKMPTPSRQALPKTPRILITGGFGGVGRALALEFADSHPGATFVLTSRDDQSEARLLTQLRAKGATATALQCDLSAPGVQLPVLETPFDLVIHAAGCADHGGVVARRDGPSVAQVLAPKIAGLDALQPVLSDQTQLVLCSTLGSWMPDAKFGQAAYAAANGYLDSAALALSLAGRRVIAINWDDWVGAGMTEDTRAAMGQPAMTPDDGLTAQEGASALAAILSAQWPRVSVSVRDLPGLMQAAKARFAIAPDTTAANAAQAVSPTQRAIPSPDAISAIVLDLFRTVLGRTDFQDTDNFFEQGGHSLMAMQILIRLRDDVGLPCALVDIFEAPSPAELTQRLIAKAGTHTKDIS